MFKQAKISLYLLSATYIVLGVVLMVWPGRTLTVLCLLVGLVIALSGVRLLVRYLRTPSHFFLRHLSLVGGIICCALGGFLCLKPALIISLVPVVFGLFIIFDSLVRLGDAWALRRAGGFGSMLVLVLLSCLLGILMICDPFGAAETMTMAMGAILLVESVLNLTTAGYVQVKLRAWSKAHPEVLEGEGVKEAIEGEAPAVDVEFHAVDEAPANDAPADEASANT